MRILLARTRLSPALCTTFALSTALHAAVFLGYSSAVVSAPRPGVFEPIQVSLVGNPASSRPTQTVAKIPASTDANSVANAPKASAAEPAVDAAAPDTTGDPQPVVESRYDVAALNNPKPPYPTAARRRGIEGRVVLAALVRADGNCEHVRIDDSSGHEILDRAARDTVRHWKFIPARRGTQAIDAWVQIPIVFRLNATSKN